jgi:hypothetical protein
MNYIWLVLFIGIMCGCTSKKNDIILVPSDTLNSKFTAADHKWVWLGKNKETNFYICVMPCPPCILNSVAKATGPCLPIPKELIDDL